MSRCVVIDANRIFSELIAANHRLRQTFASEPETEFLCPKCVMVELFKHKERIAASTGLDEDSRFSTPDAKRKGRFPFAEFRASSAHTSFYL